MHLLQGNDANNIINWCRVEEVSEDRVVATKGGRDSGLARTYVVFDPGGDSSVACNGMLDQELGNQM